MSADTYRRLPLDQSADPSAVVILRSEDGSPYKRFRRTDGTVDADPPQPGKRFTPSVVAVDTFDGMARLLSHTASRRDTLMVRGALTAEGVDQAQRGPILRRSNPDPQAGTPATLEPCRRRVLVVDVDSFMPGVDIDWRADPEAAVRAVLGAFPSELTEASVWWSWSASQGIKPGLRLRLAWLLAEPISNAEATAWLLAENAPADRALFRTAQPIYLAAPSFEGLTDPLEGLPRCGVVRGRTDLAPVPAGLADLALQYDMLHLDGLTLRPARRKPLPVGDGNGADGAPLPPVRDYAEALTAIGDHDGGHGLFRAVRRAIALAWSERGAGADAGAIVREIRDRLDAATWRPGRAGKLAQIRRELRGWVAAIGHRQAQAEEWIACAYPPPTCESVDQARQVVREGLAGWIGGVEGWLDACKAVDAAAEETDQPAEVLFAAYPAAPVVAVKAGVGVGKSAAARQVVPRLLNMLKTSQREGRAVAWAAPTHDLAGEAETALEAEVREHGFSVARYFGRAYEWAPGAPMCFRHEDAARIGRNGGDAARLCSFRGKMCPHHPDNTASGAEPCRYVEMQRQTADLWILPHASLFRARPACVPEPGVLVVDESFWSGSVDLSGVKLADLIDPLSVAAGEEGAELGERDKTAALRRTLERLATAFDAMDDGPVNLATLRTYVSAADLAEARRALLGEKKVLQIHPGLTSAQVKDVCDASPNGRILKRAKALAVLADALAETGVAVTGRAALSRGRNGGGYLNLRTCRQVAEGWRRGAVLLLDADYEPRLAAAVLPEADRAELVEATAPAPYMEVTQATDFSGARTSLVADDSSDAARTYAANNRARLLRFIEVEADRVRGRGAAGGPDMLVICPLVLEERINRQVPGNVEVAHFGGLRGIDRWKGVASVLVVGRDCPTPEAMETTASALFGHAPASVAEWYARERVGLRMRSGGDYGPAVQADRHPDPLVELVRRATVESEVSQAIGRCRGVCRSAENPVRLVVVGKMAVPGVEVDHVVRWRDLEPTPADLLSARGVMPAQDRKLSALFPLLAPDLWKNQRAFTNWRKDNLSLYNDLIEACRKVPFTPILVKNLLESPYEVFDQNDPKRDFPISLSVNLARFSDKRHAEYYIRGALGEAVTIEWPDGADPFNAALEACGGWDGLGVRWAQRPPEVTFDVLADMSGLPAHALKRLIRERAEPRTRREEAAKAVEYLAPGGLVDLIYG